MKIYTEFLLELVNLYNDFFYTPSSFKKYRVSYSNDNINLYSGESIEDEGEISSNIDIIEYHKNYEMKSATLGACYEKFYSNSGGFCSKCGMCAKSNKDCIRCKIIN